MDQKKQEGKAKLEEYIRLRGRRNSIETKKSEERKKSEEMKKPEERRKSVGMKKPEERKKSEVLKPEETKKPVGVKKQEGKTKPDENVLRGRRNSIGMKRLEEMRKPEEIRSEMKKPETTKKPEEVKAPEGVKAEEQINVTEEVKKPEEMKKPEGKAKEQIKQEREEKKLQEKEKRRLEKEEKKRRKVRIKGKKPKGNCCYDDTIEYYDRYSNLEVGTQFDLLFHGHEVSYYEKEAENYTYIVDLDAFEYHKIVFHHFLGEILQSIIFRFSILALVLINSILIGVNTDRELVEKNKSLLGVFDQIILSIFVFEIILKWMYDFRLFWAVWWNILDFVIVVLIVMAAILPVIGASRATIALVRVVRAFRSLRSVSWLTSLTVVTHTMFKSIVDMLNILFVLIIFMLVLAIAGVILFDIEGLKTKRFLSTFDAWFVLFICVTQDGWISVLDEFRGADDFLLIAIYLMIGVAIGAFIFANLIVAVVVANLELSVRELREERIRTENQLDYHGQFSATTLELVAVYSILSNRNIPLLAQRPLQIPTVKNMSSRRLQAYIALIVALEQNMLEFAVILRDYERVMTVLMSIAKQLDQNGPSLLEEVLNPKDTPKGAAAAGTGVGNKAKAKIDGKNKEVPQGAKAKGQP